MRSIDQKTVRFAWLLAVLGACATGSTSTEGDMPQQPLPKPVAHDAAAPDEASSEPSSSSGPGLNSSSSGGGSGSSSSGSGSGSSGGSVVVGDDASGDDASGCSVDLRRVLRHERQLRRREGRLRMRPRRRRLRRLHGHEPDVPERVVRRVGILQRQLLRIVERFLEREFVGVVQRQLLGIVQRIVRRQLQSAQLPHGLLPGRQVHEAERHDVRQPGQRLQGLHDDQQDLLRRFLPLAREGER